MLQKALTIHEIDQALARLAHTDRQWEDRSELLLNELSQLEDQIKDNRERAGLVIRAYYNGSRPSLLLTVLESRSLSDALTVLSYLQRIFASDKATLDRYADQQAQIRKVQQELDETRQELADLRQQYLTQRERLSLLEEELNQGLANVDEAETVMAQMSQLTQSWNEEGLPLFRQYLKALSKAMENLPSLLQSEEGVLKTRGLGFAFELSDEQLNRFLQAQNDLFEDFSFTFHPDYIEAGGQREGTHILLTGYYTIADEPEHHIRFELDELTYNGFALPDLTVQQVSEEFKLGFYPKKVFPLLKAESIEMEENKLQIELGLGR